MTDSQSTVQLIPTKILLVDDKFENLFAMQKVLESPTLEIYTAQSGNEALALLLHHDFAVALLDVQMPEMDGFELAQLMQGNKELEHIPIIFVTAISKDEKYVFKGYGHGAVDYLVKPVDPDIVKSKVNVFCQMYVQRQELEIEIKKRKETQEHNEKLIDELQVALERINTLRGIIPICANCKNIRDDKGYWHQVEVYIRDHSDAEFSHALCNNCTIELYPDLAEEVLKGMENAPRDDQEESNSPEDDKMKD